MSVPVKIVVVYHSGYGHTVKIAEAVARGAAAIDGASVELVTADEAPGRWELLDNSDAIIMGAPTYMGSLSAQFKTFMDATSHLQYAQKRWAGKVAAGFTNGASRGGDKQNSLVQLMTFAASAAFVVPEADLLLELQVVALDAPAQLGDIDEATETGARRKRRQPVPGRLGFAVRPFDRKFSAGILTCCLDRNRLEFAQSRSAATTRPSGSARLVPDALSPQRTGCGVSSWPAPSRGGADHVDEDAQAPE
jgi:multimeric flavodoxin WrbA